ncbi:hypothetical protein Shel_07340 [Slackia heliotrinireducens DSM 20476]|uniref:Uncharacterized protein n=1 Tax=Slackia heliotrinireducens (strain ATCC 29202 / DSM 20476 / NCTC 11029 / RHS 1) TaxID=471855 RepID=C7N4F7_SLAHD|nr:hypothetical protein Shel_07340 [Slackia heliotrinireducens DSM 20476]
MRSMADDFIMRSSASTMRILVSICRCMVPSVSTACGIA